MGPPLTGNEIRQRFLDYFQQRGHRVVRSSSLVPAGDPTLLFTNAGMNQFKEVFLGIEQREYRRATSCQKCVRAGGKHNDLENVGFTNRHHTFFEMLGNFSFGDYFKKDAIAYAWELITSRDWFAIPKDKLYVTIFRGGNGVERDTEARTEWLAQGVSAERIYELGAKENFWAMGDTGPCGPCSEIHYDMGPAASEKGHQGCAFPCECGRYVEIWNLVFMQFNRDSSGALQPLPKSSVDTGAGLERLAAVLQDKVSNFDTDLFLPLVHEAAALTGAKPGASPDTDASLRIIADHARAATFLISDGVVPANEGRGYVLRKILRRAIRHAGLLGAAEPILYKMVDIVLREMSGAYPELNSSATMVSNVVLAEEQRFAHTVAIGLDKLEEIFPSLTSKVFPGEDAFKLYDTFGLPRDFIEDIVRDQGFTFDAEGFERALEEQRHRARASWKGASRVAVGPIYSHLAGTFRTEPGFYDGTTARDCRVEAIFQNGSPINELPAGAEGEVVLDRTSIYAESGGQQADTGAFYDPSGSTKVADVQSAYYPVSGLVAHRVVALEPLHLGDRVTTMADSLRRTRNRRNHTGTHLVHAALRNTLGTHVKQAGSLVSPDHLRFDFSHYAAVDSSQLADIEQQVNEEILRDAEVRTDILPLDEALAAGALAFFGDKYPEHNVRVVTILDSDASSGFYSKELCGGTHVGRAGEIGIIKILGEQSVAAGVRRIQAITGDVALEEFRRSAGLLSKVASRLNASDAEVIAKLDAALERLADVLKERDTLRRKAALSQADSLLASAREIKRVHVVAARVDGLDRDTLRQLADTLRQKMGSGAVVLASAGEGGNVALIAAVTKDLASKLHAGKIIQQIARLVGGSGGGRPDLAEAGGKDTAAIENALSQVFPILEQML
jgi:alanyl-tRNA synthetase